MNEVKLQGVISRVYTPTTKSVSFSVDCKEDESKPFGVFITCRANVDRAQELEEGKKITIEGSIQSSSYVDKSGEKKKSVYVWCKKLFVEGMTGKPKPPQMGYNKPPIPQEYDHSEDVPF